MAKKKYIPKIEILLSLSLLMFGSQACAQEKPFPKTPHYESPTPGSMPIIATYAFYQPELITKERFKELNEAGFNLARQSLPENLVDKTLEVVDGTGVKLMLAAWGIDMPDMTDRIVRKYRHNPNIKAYNIKDEPNASQFGTVKAINDLAAEADSTKLRFINLLPAVGAKTLGTPTYREYVETFVRDVNPQILSFDCYPIKLDKNGRVYVYDRYFETLEVISDVARRSGRPFMSYVQSTRHNDFPKPTRDYLRYQVFTALAYGAQGLSYFTYTRPDFDKTGAFTDAPLGTDGKRTDVWYMVRDINREVRNLEKVFLGAEVVDVSHTGTVIPAGTKRLSSLPAPFKWMSSNGEGVLVSHLRNGSDEYLLIVNRDVRRKQKVTFGTSGAVTRVYGSGEEKKENSKSVTLTPGGYAIYRL